MNKDNGVWIYDIETFINVFTYTGKNRDTQEVVQFVIWKEKNEIVELLRHLETCKGMVGYNNLNFDYPVIHYIIKSFEKLFTLSGDKVASLIYKKAQNVIESVYSQIKDEDTLVPQLDLFRIWHFDNKARITSLKKLEINMNYPNVQDIPYHHSVKIKTESQVQEILDYNVNDVSATEEFYYKTEDKINLRKGILKKYGLPCLNYPDSKIGEQLMLKLYCTATNQEEDDVKKKRTRRNLFKFKESIPPYVKFRTDEFKNVLTYLEGIEVPELKESFAYSFTANNFQFDLGTGGIHGCIKAGVYDADGDDIIIDSDVASLYPSLAISNNLYPEHLGEEFSQIYENGIVKPRLEAKKNGDKVMADGFKLSSNAVYGKSNSEFSFLYDPLYTLNTTLAGQLSLLMLSEFLFMRIPNIVMLQINTDGLTTKFDKKYLDLYLRICKYWEDVVKLSLEHVEYSKMVIRDVNNYIAVSSNEIWYKDDEIHKKEKITTKYKGTFKDNYQMRNDGEWQKSFSQGVVATATNKFFLENIPVEKTITECTDIYEFCKTGNTTGSWWAETFVLDEEGNPINILKQQKNNRYFLSTDGVSFRKCAYKPDKKTGEEKLNSTEYEAGRKVTMFNKFYELDKIEDYNIDIQYYINECYKLIHKIDGTEERLLIELKEKREREKQDKERENYFKYCIDKVPTERQFELYKREWLIDKYGYPTEIKPSKTKQIKTDVE